MTKIRLAEQQDLEFIQKIYQKLDEVMMKLYSEIINVDMEEDNNEDLHTVEYWMQLTL